MPSAAAIARSSGVVMNPRMRPALAPTYAVVTVMAAFSLRGYCRTLSERMACTPAMTMSRLTTMARTGRRMKRSVNFICSSLLHGLRIGLHVGRELVVHRQRRPVVQLECAARNDGLAGLEARAHRHEVAAPLAQPDELLVGDEVLVLL